MWLRYVDDTFVLWPQLEDDQELLDHVNSIRPSIQFTMEKEQRDKLSFLDLLVTRTEQNFNSLYPYNVKKRLVCCLQHRAKAISTDMDVYQEKMIILRYNLHNNNYPECITSALRNLDRMIEDNTRKLTTVRLPYVKGLIERIQRICSPYYIGTIFTRGSTLGVKLPTEFNIIKNCVYSMPCSCGKVYKSETWRPINIRLDEHQKAVVRGEIERSGMADRIWKEKWSHLLLWDKGKIIDRDKHWKIRRPKESAHM